MGVQQQQVNNRGGDSGVIGTENDESRNVKEAVNAIMTGDKPERTGIGSGMAAMIGKKLLETSKYKCTVKADGEPDCTNTATFKCGATVFGKEFGNGERFCT